MKKHALLSIALIATCLSSFAAADFPNLKPWETLSQDIKVVQLTSLNDDDLKEIMEGKHPEIAIEFAAQTHLPVNFYLKGDVVNLAENDDKWGTIEIKQTFYARLVGEELILSSNLTDWKPFMEFITGTATITLSVQDGQPSIVESLIFQVFLGLFILSK
jgi:hypothetical protein